MEEMAMAKESKETKIEPRRTADIRPWRFSDFDSVFDRMFGSSWMRPFPRPWSMLETETLPIDAPAVDMYEEKDELVVKAEMPGLAKEDLDVTVTGNTLTIKGEKKKEEEVKEKDYYRCERSYGSFSRSIELPAEVKTDQVKASFKNGVLEIRLPKTEEAKNNVVQVKVA
jgi:HSP20 family protein